MLICSCQEKWPSVTEFNLSFTAWIYPSVEIPPFSAEIFRRMLLSVKGGASFLLQLCFKGCSYFLKSCIYKSGPYFLESHEYFCIKCVCHSNFKQKALVDFAFDKLCMHTINTHALQRTVIISLLNKSHKVQ